MPAGVLGYALFGALLGLAGNFFRLSPLFTASLVIAVSGLMVVLGLQMLGVKALANFRSVSPNQLPAKSPMSPIFKAVLPRLSWAP